MRQRGRGQKQWVYRLSDDAWSQLDMTSRASVSRLMHLLWERAEAVRMTGPETMTGMQLLEELNALRAALLRAIEEAGS